MSHESKSQQSSDPDGGEEFDRQINERLTNYIKANAVQAERPTRAAKRRTAASLIAIPFLFAIALPVFVLAISASLLTSLRAGRGSTKLWDNLGFPVLARDMDDERS